MNNSFSSYPLILSQNSRTPTWFWSGKEEIDLSSELIKSLEMYSDEHQTNCRICLHTSPNELCHVMIIVERKGMNIPPHWHYEKSDFLFIINGVMDYFVFDESTSQDKVKLKKLQSMQGVKSPPESIHAIGISSTRCTYLETSTGPFKAESDAIYPTWAASWHGSYCCGIIDMELDLKND